MVSSREEHSFLPRRRLGGVVLAKPDQLSILRHRAYLSLNHPVKGKSSSFFEKKEDSSLTITASAGFSPSVKKPLATGERSGFFLTNSKSSSFLWSKEDFSFLICQAEAFYKRLGKPTATGGKIFTLSSLRSLGEWFLTDGRKRYLSSH